VAIAQAALTLAAIEFKRVDTMVTYTLGAKGVIECELVSSGERWGRGPRQDLHSSNEARVDSPAWHLVQALATLVGTDGHTPAIEGYADKARPLTADEKALIREAARRQNEEAAKRQMGVERWVHDVDWLESLAFGHTSSIGERVLIIGVGNTAMDCCRSARRLGGKDVKVMARRPRGFFKASPWELDDAEEEGIDIVINHAPKRFVVENGVLKGMEFQ
jgi:hypothetical protein